MTYYDKQGKPVDTSDLWRVPSYQAQPVYDSLSHNKPRNAQSQHQNYPNTGGHNRHQGYQDQGGYQRPGIDTDGLFAFAASVIRLAFRLAKWLVLGGGVMLATTVLYGFLALASLYNEWDLFDDATLLLVGTTLAASLLIGGLIGMMATLNRSARDQGPMLSVIALFRQVLDGWLRMAVLATSVPLLPLTGFYAATLWGHPEAQAIAPWLAIPALIAAGHIGFTRLMPRRYAISLLVVCLVVTGLGIALSL